MLPNTQYSKYGPDWCSEMIDELNGTAFRIGIESDRKRRGSAVNVEVFDPREDQHLFVLCVRKSEFRPGRFTRVCKDYFLCGRNENGNVFAHPVRVNSISAKVEVALCRIWSVTPSLLKRIVRQGDCGLVPELKMNFSDVDRFDVREFTTDDGSHLITSDRVYVSRDCKKVYVNGSVSIRHLKSQHPFVAVTLPSSVLYRVQLGLRVVTWGFAAPTAD